MHYLKVQRAEHHLCHRVILLLAPFVLNMCNQRISLLSCDTKASKLQNIKQVIKHETYNCGNNEFNGALRKNGSDRLAVAPCASFQPSPHLANVMRIMLVPLSFGSAKEASVASV
jgi:hypothetical protein